MLRKKRVIPLITSFKTCSCEPIDIENTNAGDVWVRCSECGGVYPTERRVNPMNRIEEIKERIKKHRETEHSTPISHHYQFGSDVEHLLSKLEIAEKALEYAVKVFDTSISYVDSHYHEEEFICQLNKTKDNLKNTLQQLRA
jgi:zona occludens toxin (predicted ATPase)